MADIFLSYAQADAKRAKQVAEALETKGWSVWWDAALRPGEVFRDRIVAELQAARCVVVLWSKASLASHWVIDEAEDGKKRRILVQALIEDVWPPHGFRQIQAAMLKEWNGSDSGEFARLCDGIAAYAPLADLSTRQSRLPAVVEKEPLIASPNRAASSTNSLGASPEEWRYLEQRFRDIQDLPTLRAVLVENAAWRIDGGNNKSRRDFDVLATMAGSLLRKSQRTWGKIDSAHIRESLFPKQRWLHFVKWTGAERGVLVDKIGDVVDASANACARCAAYEHPPTESHDD